MSHRALGGVGGEASYGDSAQELEIPGRSREVRFIWGKLPETLRQDHGALEGPRPSPEMGR